MIKSSIQHWLKRNLGLAQALLLVLVFGLVTNGTPRMEVHSHAADGHAITEVSADHEHDHGHGQGEDDSHHVTHVHTAPTLTATLPPIVGEAFLASPAAAWRPALRAAAPPSAVGPPPYRPPIA